MRTLIFTARSLANTAESIATPCSVNAYGKWRRPPQLEVAICDSSFQPRIPSGET
jgi:hypothetical protein